MTGIHEPIISDDAELVRPTHVEVDLSALTDNFRAIQRQVAGSKVLVTLKANAYGHGLVRVAQHMQQLGASCLGVAFLEEGILLRKSGVDMPILVQGAIMNNQIPLFLQHDLIITASSVEKLEQIEEAARQTGTQARVHLKIDTGMERIGVHYYNASTLFEAALACHHCQVEGIYSHFANSDAADLSYTRLQLARFNEAMQFYEQRGLPLPVRHLANSGAILQLPESYFEMVRAGILLYGIYPSNDVPQTVQVRPALTWKSRVVYFKVVLPGHPIGYGSTYTPQDMVRVVTIPVGYGDGYFRALSNKGQVVIRGKRYPVVGRVSMDQITVSIGWESAYNGDEVILLGDGEGAAVTVDEVAEWAGTIPYEVLTNINTRVPRIYYDEPKHRG